MCPGYCKESVLHRHPKYAVIQQRHCIFSWTSHGSNGLRTMNSFGFMIVTAISHQGTEESCNFLSGRILLFVSLLAGEMNECVAANSIQLLNGETQLVTEYYVQYSILHNGLASDITQNSNNGVQSAVGNTVQCRT